MTKPEGPSTGTGARVGEPVEQLELGLAGEPERSPRDFPTDLPFDVALLSLGSVRGLSTRSLHSLAGSLGDCLGYLLEIDLPELAAILGRHKIADADNIASRMAGSRESLLEVGLSHANMLDGKNVRLMWPSQMPAKLASLRGGPSYLFVQGDPAALMAAPHVAVVGTRASSDQGRRAAGAAVRTMAAYPITLVSGLAEGIDEAAHAFSLADGLRNVAFLGHGTDLVFPARTSGLREKIVDAGGAVVSEYLPKEHYRKQQFVQRNRLQAALADIVVAVEGEASGGTAHTVRFAEEFGRRVIGFQWEGARDLVQLINEQRNAQVIDVFTTPGRRLLDEEMRDVARQYGHDTSALRLVERQLERESLFRRVERRDISRMREILTRLEKREMGDTN